MVHEAGLRVGVPDRVVQPGGELERQLPIAAGADHRGQLDRGREQLGGEPAGAELGRHVGPGRARLGDRSSAPSSPNVSGISAYPEIAGQPASRPSRYSRPGCGSSPRLATATSIWRTATCGRSSGHGGRQRGEPGVADQADFQRCRAPVQERRERSQSRRGYQQRADHVRVPGQCGARCAATASGSGALPGGNTAASSTRPRSSAGTCVDTAMNLADATYGGQLCPIIGRCCPKIGTTAGYRHNNRKSV